MKKLMILAAVAMSAVCSQAINVTWATTGVYKYSSPTSSTKAGSETKGWWVSSSDYAYDDAVADLAKGDIEFLSTYGQGGKAFNGTGTASGLITTKASGGDTFKGYVVILDNTDMAKATYAYITPTEKSGTAPKSGGLNFGWTSSDMAGTATASNWNAVNVPEPTSGMLLLLGFAGLALKRKRA